METLRQHLSEFWQSIPLDYRVEIFGGIIAGVALGALVVFRQSVLASSKWLVGRFRKPAELPPPSPPPIPIEIKVTTQLPPQIEPAAVDAVTYAPFIPPPPSVGFVARRDKEDRDILETLKQSLAPTSSQLVALWGDGGHGKTTLAAEAARALKEVFKERIIWVSAEKRADFGFSTLLDEIAQKLGRNDLLKYALEPKKAEVQALLASAPTLVVLDNFETVAPDAEQKLCAEFLAQDSPSPALITTREWLAGAKNIPLEKMTPAEANKLLELLIAEANIEQVIVGLNRDLIIQAADRNPLVLEWIVGQMRSDQPHVVLNDLKHGKGDAMQRVFDRSFNLRQLGNDGRDTLLALSLFVPSATREALAEVAGLGEDVGRLREPARRLMDLGLLRMTAGNERLFVEGLTRQLAQVRLAEDERADQFHRRYAAYFLRYAEERATPEDYDALEAERDNLLRAADTAFAHEDWERVMRMAYALANPVSGMLSVRGYWDEALRLGELALKAVRSSQIEVQVASLSHNLAVMYQNRGELPEARRLYNESLEIKKKLGNQGGIASTLHQLGRLAEAQGDKAEASQLFREALSIFERLGSPNAEIARRSLERVKGEIS